MVENTAQGEWTNRQEVGEEIIIYGTKLVRYRLRHILILSDIIYHIFLFVTVNKHAILTAFIMMCVCVCVCVWPYKISLI